MKLIKIMVVLFALNLFSCNIDHGNHENEEGLVSIDLELNLNNYSFIAKKRPTKNYYDEYFESGLLNSEIFKIITNVFNSSTFYITDGSDGVYGEAFRISDSSTNSSIYFLNSCNFDQSSFLCDGNIKTGYFCKLSFKNYVTFSSKEDEELAENYAAPDYYILPNSKEVYDRLSTLFFA